MLVRRTFAAALVLAAGVAHAASPEPLSFAVGEARYTVPDGGLTRVTHIENKGLTFCLSPAAEEALSAFTRDHSGELVTVAIGEREVFRIQIAEPYKGGCINWPLHPGVAENYRALLTGAEPKR